MPKSSALGPLPGRLRLALPLLLAAASTASDAAALDARITLRETAGISRRAEVVSFGLPVGREEGLRSAANLVVTGSDGAVLPAQLRVTSRWAAGPAEEAAPIRWLLVHVQVDLAAGARVTLRVRAGASPDPTPMRVTASPDAYEVETGALTARISRQRSSVLESVRVGDAEQVDASDAGHGFAVTTPAGQVLSAIRDGRVLSTDVLENGPLVTTLRQEIELDDARLRDESSEAWGANACFSWLYPCTELQRYRLRISVWSRFVQGSRTVRILARAENVSVCPVTEDGAKHCWLEGSLHSLGFEDLTLRVALAGVHPGYVSGAVEGGLEAPVSVYQDSSGLDSWDAYQRLPLVTSWTPGDWSARGPANVRFRGYRTTEGAGVVAAGDRMPGWLQVTSPSGGVAVAVADAWKHFPLALRGSSRAVEAGLFPREFAAAFGLRPGERKTHALALVFGADGTGSEAAQAQIALERPIRFAFDPDRAVATGAIPGLSRVGLEPDYDLWNRASVDVAVSQAHNPYPWSVPSSMPVARDRHGLWGKKEAGFLPNDNEAETSTDLSKYSQYHGFLLQALRNAGADDALSDAWWELATDANRAQEDFGYLVLPYAVPGSDWRGLHLAHCFHENPENRTFPRGGGFGCDFAGDVTGMGLHYVLTGYEPALDAIVAHVENVRAEALRRSSYRLEARAFASRIEVLVAAFELFGERRDLDAALHLLSRMEAAGETAYLQCPCPGASPEQSLNAFFAGWLLRSLGRLADAAIGADGPGSGTAQRAVAMLKAHADWAVRAVIFEAYSAVTGRRETVMPYLWHLDGRASNRDPVSTSYGLMMVDGLARAAVLSGEPRFAASADALFRTILAMPFFFGDWPPFVYSTINDAGKLASFGGEHIEALHGAPPAADHVSLSAHGHLALEISGAVQEGDLAVARDAAGLHAVSGDAVVATASGLRPVGFDLGRLAGTSFLTGTVRAEGAGGVAHALPVWVAVVTEDADAIQGIALYADVFGTPPLWGLLRFRVQDRAGPSAP